MRGQAGGMTGMMLEDMRAGVRKSLVIEILPHLKRIVGSVSDCYIIAIFYIN